jgi:hypothetical protein
VTVTVVVVGLRSEDDGGSAELVDGPPGADDGATVSGTDTVGMTGVGEFGSLRGVVPVTDEGGCGDGDSGAEATGAEATGEEASAGDEAARPDPPMVVEQPARNSAAAAARAATATAKGWRAGMV